MIELSEVFNMIGTNGCQDVATSLQMQGVDTDISIPIYEVFYLKIAFGDNAKFLCGSIPEYTALRQMAQSCGAVACTVNLLEMDILTLLGLLCIFTPNTGMTVFVKYGDILTGELEEDISKAIVELSGLPIPDGVFSNELVFDAIKFLLDRLTDALHNNLAMYGINLLDWAELPNFFMELRESGEMQMMMKYRQMFGGAIF